MQAPLASISASLAPNPASAAPVVTFKKDPEVTEPIIRFQEDKLDGLSVKFVEEQDQQPASPPAKSLDEFIFKPIKKWTPEWLKLPPEVILLSIPFFGVGYESYLEGKVDKEGEEIVKANPHKFDKLEIPRLIEKKNEIKNTALIALGVNAFVFSLAMVAFPLASSMLATGYLCLILRNLVQVNANKLLIKDIENDIVIAPVGQNKKVPRDKKEFFWHVLVE